MADEMDVDQPKTKGKKEAKDSSKARFEVKKVTRTVIIGQWVLIILLIGSGTPSLSGHGVNYFYYHPSRTAR